MRWNEENEMFIFYQVAIALRKEYKALRRGEYRTLHAKKGNNFYLFERYMKEECLFIGLNVGEEAVKLDLSMENKVIIMQFGFSENLLSGYGYVIVKQLGIN